MGEKDRQILAKIVGVLERTGCYLPKMAGRKPVARTGNPGVEKLFIKTALTNGDVKTKRLTT